MREQSFPMQSYLEQYYPFWPHLNPKEQEQLCSCSQLQTCQKGDFLYSHDDDCLGILLVLKGQLRIFIQSGDTREITLFRVGDGQVCTLSASCIIQEINFDIQIEADEDTELIVTNVSCFRTLMNQNIYVENYIYKETTEHFSDVMWAMNQILFPVLTNALPVICWTKRSAPNPMFCIQPTSRSPEILEAPGKWFPGC